MLQLVCVGAQHSTTNQQTKNNNKIKSFSSGVTIAWWNVFMLPLGATSQLALSAAFVASTLWLNVAGTAPVFATAVERCAAGLAALGVGEGSRISWQLPTTFETHTRVFSTSVRGGTAFCEPPPGSGRPECDVSH